MNHVLDRLETMNRTQAFGFDMPNVCYDDEFLDYMCEREEYMRAMAKVQHDYEVWKQAQAKHEEESK